MNNDCVTADEFPAVIGQKSVKNRLKKAILNDRLAHAYLFTGQSGTGRMAMAHETARVLNCLEGHEFAIVNRCKCASCINMRRWQHPHLIPLFPLPSLEKAKGSDARKTLNEIIGLRTSDLYNQVTYSGSGRILIDQVRELRKRLALASDRKGIRTVIIEPVDRMTAESANAILKLLEEPPEDCCLILVTENLRSLLPTMVSRCQVVTFSPLTAEEITTALVDRKGGDRENAEQVAHIASGSYTQALSMLDGDISSQLDSGLEFLRSAAMDNALNITTIVDGLAREISRQTVKEQLYFTASWIKDAMIHKSFNPEQTNRYLSIPQQEQVTRKMAVRYSITQLVEALDNIEEAIIAVDSNVNLPMLLTALALKINRALQ